MKLLVTFLTLLPILYATTVETLHTSQQESNRQLIASQATIDKSYTNQQKLYDNYLLLAKELEEQEAYNTQLKGVLSTLDAEIPLLDKQLEHIGATHKKIVPHMLEMIQRLEQFIALDLPFLHEERARRVNSLKALMKRSDVSIATQYRAIIEAYKIENEYGRTMESYRAEVQMDNKEVIVDFLRIGRLSLYYLSLDQKKSAIYDKEKKSYVALDSEYNAYIRKGIKMARKKLAAELLTLPLSRGE